MESHIQSALNVEGKKQNDGKAKQCGENPKTATQSVEIVENDLGVENEKQDECIVQEEGNDAVQEPAESIEAGPIPATAEECSSSEEGLMEEEDTVCKTPLLKRKQGSETCGSKAKKVAGSEGQEGQTESESSGEEEEEEEMEEGQPLTDSPMLSASQLDELYTVHSIQMFLQKTKNMKNVKFDEYFADKELLLLSIKSQMSRRGEGGFSEQEVYRLKKIALRLKQELRNDEDSECL